MISNKDAISAIDIMLTEPIFISEGEIQTITGYYREDFEDTLQKLRENASLMPKDYFLIRQALATFGAFHISPERMRKCFGVEYNDKTHELMKKIDDQLDFDPDSDVGCH